MIRNAKVFALEDGNEEEGPSLLDVWVGGGKILALTPPSSSSICPTTPGLQEIDASGMYVVPGFVDVHQHVTGGGGEGGFSTRTPEAVQNDLIDAGVTTFVATLGTDCVTRGMEHLIAKTRSLSSQGITGLAWLGGYAFPIENSVTGSIRRDVTLIPEIIGVGELAVSDHRASFPSVDELVRLSSEVRVAGMISGKCGVTYCHLGEEDSALEPLKAVVNRNPMLLKFVVPTHLERSPQLIEEAINWMISGGFADFSGWPERQRPAIKKYLEDPKNHKVVHQRLLISSDSFGSINEFDESGKVIKYSYGLPNSLLRTFLALVWVDRVPIVTALRFFSRNPAAMLRLDEEPVHKGKIHVGGTADLLVLKLPPVPLPKDYPCDTNLRMKWPSTEGVLQYVIAGGHVLKCP